MNDILYLDMWHGEKFNKMSVKWVRTAPARGGTRTDLKYSHFIKQLKHKLIYTDIN